MPPKNNQIIEVTVRDGKRVVEEVGKVVHLTADEALELWRHDPDFSALWNPDELIKGIDLSAEGKAPMRELKKTTGNLGEQGPERRGR